MPSLGANGAPVAFNGTSAAAPLVTGTVALLWSIFPQATAVQMQVAVRGSGSRGAVVPPWLDATYAYRALAQQHGISRAARQEV